MQAGGHREPCSAERWRWVPSVLHDSFVTDGATAGAGYPLIAFPREPWTLTTAHMGLTQAGEWADRLNHVSDERQAIAMSFLEQAGAPTGALGDEAEGWLALGS